MSTKDRTQSARNKRYRNRMQERGFFLLQVWCRPKDREKVRAYARELMNTPDDPHEA